MFRCTVGSRLCVRTVAARTSPSRGFSTGPSSSSPVGIVNSWTEFDPLEEVIVGVADNSAVPPDEPGHRSKVWHLPNTVAAFGSMRAADKVSAAAKELDNLATVLASRGVKVRRPKTPPNRAVVTPSFGSERMNGWTCPRDTLLVVGPEIIEAPLCWRSRAFEKFAYRDLLLDYHARDPHFLWSSAPHPELPDSLFRPNYEAEGAQGGAGQAGLGGVTEHGRLAQVGRKEFVTVDGVEPVFDAADAIRVGRDVFVLHSHTCNVLGYEWLARQLGRRDVRTHLVHMPTVHNASHIDASIVPLRPPTADRNGTVLVAPLIEDTDIVRLFAANRWDVLMGPEPDRDPTADPSYHGKSGKWISLNVLPLDHDTVILAEHDVSLIKALQARGFECVTVPFTNVIEFGGGLHCCTLDVRRRGDACVDYFPSLSQ